MLVLVTPRNAGLDNQNSYNNFFIILYCNNIIMFNIINFTLFFYSLMCLKITIYPPKYYYKYYSYSDKH